MPLPPKSVEEKMNKVLTAWKTLAPAKSFGGMTVAEYESQVIKSRVPRQALDSLEDEVMGQQALRDAEDLITLGKIELVVAGVIADPTEGNNSALYEAMGYIRKSERKSGLTRKKVSPAPNPA